MNSRLKKVSEEIYRRALLFNNPYYFYGLANSDYSVQKNIVKLKKLGLEFEKEVGKSLLLGYSFALKIKEALGGKYRVENGHVFLALDDLTFQINSPEELFIIYEVFVTYAYKYRCSRETIFIDIGMNSGITTLFYARDPKVKKIYSFELFQPTFLLGYQNLKLNSRYASKVEAFNYGLSDKDFETALDYSLSNKGRMGLSGLPADENFEDTTKEKVIVKDINEIFEKILRNVDDIDVIVKMDCEGEEYKLVNRLAVGGFLNRLTALIIEWHNDVSLDIEEKLGAAEFHVFSQRFPNLDTGMIYAVRR